jgi:hypothetical protein
MAFNYWLAGDWQHSLYIEREGVVFYKEKRNPADNGMIFNFNLIP